MTLPRVPNWYHHVPPVQGLVPCEGALHRVSWRRGKLVLEDHDLSAENALLAFGGDPCACMQALRLWRHQFGMPPELFSSMQTYLGADAALAPKELELPRELGMDLSWDRAWRRSSFLERKQERLLQAGLRERALPLFRQHVTAEKQGFGCRVVSGVQVRVAPSIAEVKVSGEMDKVAVRAVIELHPSWLVEIWPRGIGIVDGVFVAELVDDSYDAPSVRAVRWEGDAARRVPVLAPARVTGGRLAWEDG
ncbi:MAG: hypothetical protein M3159_08205 [Actinomycetota bacterium]|nr:hypothetical protein [Actinomycetota bacterium]